MTWLLDAPVSEEPAPSVKRKRGRRLVAVLLLLVVAIALWVLLPGFVAVGQTAVLLDARPFTCTTPADVTTYASDQAAEEDAQLYVPAVRLHPGLDCTMTVVVRNDSDSDVAVDSITFPMAGARNGWGVHVDHGYAQGLSPIGGKDALDAVFDYQHDPRSGGSFGIAAHSSQRFRFHLSWSDGCMQAGGAAIFTDSPTAVVSAGPWHLAKDWDGPGYAFLAGTNTVAASCGR